VASDPRCQIVLFNVAFEADEEDLARGFAHLRPRESHLNPEVKGRGWLVFASNAERNYALAELESQPVTIYGRVVVAHEDRAPEDR
jgi:hypothetical protein